MDPHPEPVAIQQMTKRARDKNCYDYRDTLIATPMWFKFASQRKRSKREMQEQLGT